MWNYIPNMCNPPVTYNIHNFTLWFMISQNMVTFQCEHINADVFKSLHLSPFFYFIYLGWKLYFFYTFFIQITCPSINCIHVFCRLITRRFELLEKWFLKLEAIECFFFFSFSSHFYFIFFFSSKSEMPITKWLK